MSAGELADLLQLHPSIQLHRSAIYRLLRRGKLRAFRVGSGWGFSRAAIDRLVQREIGQ
jgi:excisionase family DNA binding protein